MAQRKAKLSDKAQRQLFMDAAKELECDESGKKFERAFKKIVPAKKRKK